MTDAVARRSYRSALVLLALGSALILVAFAMTWAWAVVPLATGVDDAVREQSLSGAAVLPAAAAAGWLCLAGLAAVVATRGWARIVVAVVVLLASLGIAAGSLVFAVVPSVLVEQAMAADPGSGRLIGLTATGWWAAALLGSALVAYASCWTLLRGRSWPSLGARYERSRAAAPATSAWDALDKGEDPTDDPPSPDRRDDAGPTAGGGSRDLVE